MTTKLIDVLKTFKKNVKVAIFCEGSYYRPDGAPKEVEELLAMSGYVAWLDYNVNKIVPFASLYHNNNNIMLIDISK